MTGIELTKPSDSIVLLAQESQSVVFGLELSEIEGQRTMALRNDVLSQIDAVLNRFVSLRRRAQYDDLSDLPDMEVTASITMMCDTIARFAPPQSQYAESMRALVKSYGAANGNLAPHIAGILSALRDAHDSGYLGTVAELVRAEVFADFIEMAEYLLASGYKDPAAVLIGGVLEEHLRQLSIKNGVPIEIAGKPKKAEQLNTDLTGQSVYSKLDQKSVTSWLGLRNNAAHGKYAEYTSDQVTLLLQGVRDFMVRNSA
ncbi:MAG: hypothetical protein ACLQHF_11095 [Terracidiphilus sp.]